jgi:hypothetical protein
VIVVALAVGFVVWLLFIRGDDSEDAGGSSPVVEKRVDVVPAADVLDVLAGVGYPVYWVGERPNVRYEVTRISDGRAYVRYLPEGVGGGSDQPFLTVGSYRKEDALGVIEELAEKPGAERFELDDGGLGVSPREAATSVYLAYPGVDVQVEVFHPDTSEVRELVESGAVAPVG